MAEAHAVTQDSGERREHQEERKRLRDLAMRMHSAWDEVAAALEAVQAPGGNTIANLERLSRANGVVASLQERGEVHYFLHDVATFQEAVSRAAECTATSDSAAESRRDTLSR